ncbi:MAG: DrmB family protein [Ignavibacteriaceae bacterium]|nr:DrmB family protein [Ignavibacteriaceae bacterium]
MSKFPVGEIRPSQLLWTYGPGALVDLPNLSVITMGLQSWEKNRCEPIEESRLLAAVRIILGAQVSGLRLPPVIQEEYVDPLSAEAKIGVPVKLFPRWLRCVKCGLLAEYESGLFEIKSDLFYPERSHITHQNCIHGRHSDAVPARFLLACRNGHLDDFPWHWFVHQGPSDCKGTLRFFEKGASLQTENLWVKCDTCNAARSLVHAFGAQAQQNLPACRGRHVHLDLFEQDCDESPRAVLLGATNTWFPISISVLAIPNLGSPLKKIVDDGWEYLHDVKSVELLEERIKMFTRLGKLEGIEKYKIEEIWEVIQEKLTNKKKVSTIEESDIKIPEWEIFTSPSPPTNWPHFLCRKVEPPELFKNVISDVLLVERLREVNALIGYTRVEAFEETLSEEEQPHWAPLVKGRPDWVPAIEVMVKGFF